MATQNSPGDSRDDRYVWPAVASADDYKRGHIDEEGRPWIDGHHVTSTEYERFRAEWAAFYDASRCEDPNCDGERGHDGKHFAWVVD